MGLAGARGRRTAGDSPPGDTNFYLGRPTTGGAAPRTPSVSFSSKSRVRSKVTRGGPYSAYPAYPPCSRAASSAGASPSWGASKRARPRAGSPPDCRAGSTTRIAWHGTLRRTGILYLRRASSCAPLRCSSGPRALPGSGDAGAADATRSPRWVYAYVLRGRIVEGQSLLEESVEPSTFGRSTRSLSPALPGRGSIPRPPGSRGRQIAQRAFDRPSGR